MSDLLVIPADSIIGEKSPGKLMGESAAAVGNVLESVRVGGWLLAVTHSPSAPLKGKRSYEDKRWSIVFAGDLVDHESVPFDLILAALEGEDWRAVARLSGMFAIAAFDQSTNKIFVVNDRRGQKPTFYRLNSLGAHVSSSLSSFVRLTGEEEFDKRWLWESMYFNFPVDSTTFISGVKRQPPASVLSIDLIGGRSSIDSYSGPFEPRADLMRGREALRRAAEVFANRVPKYFRGADDIACALTAGWDARTILALAPAAKSVTAYTYGTPGCRDLTMAAEAAAGLGHEHVSIPFGDEFVSELPRHAFETVFISAGLQGVLRSTLHHAYDALTNSGRQFPLTVSGIGVDTNFRGHLHTPNLISPEVAELFSGIGPRTVSSEWQAAVGPEFASFQSHIQEKLVQLETRFGPFESPAHHLTYSLYPLATHHYCGEFAVAENFTTVRVPGWDRKLIELAYSIEYSTLSYSQFVPGHKRGGREEMILQAYLFSELAPEFSRLPIRGKRPASVLAGGIVFQADRLYQGVRNRIANRSIAPEVRPLEDWDMWLFDNNQSLVRDLLLSTDALVLNYIEKAYVDRLIAGRNVRMVGKLMTAEIILRLIRSGWQKFW